MILDEVVVKNHKAIAHRIIDGQAVIVNLKEETFNTLDFIGTKIWELIDGKIPIRNIVEQLQKKFDVDQNDLEKGCLEFITQMVNKNLLVWKTLKTEEEDLFEELREKAIKKKIPIICHFDLTYRCNLQCVHCYIKQESRPEFTTSEIKGILNQLVEAEALYLTLSGGEILTRKDFFEIASYTRELNFALRLLTNGILIDEDMADKIASLTPELVSISIYSLNPEIHDGITGLSGSFQKSMAAIEMLRQRGIKLKLATIVMRQNANDYQTIYELTQEIGAKFQADYRITPKLDGNQCSLKYHINDEDLNSLLADPIFLEENDFDLQEDYSGIFSVIPCGAGHMSCYISPYGDVCPCIQFPLRCGNLKERSFIDIWKQSSELLNFRSLTISKLPTCSQCDFFQYCRLCVGLNYVEKGDLTLPSERSCKEAKIMKTLGKRRR